MSGLESNPLKNNIYFGGVSQEVKALILKYSHFAEGTFPFKYLGIPLSTSRLSGELYHYLLDKIKAKLLHWSSHLLSYAGKIQLLNSVIFGLENFWCTCLLLPEHIIKKIEKVCRQFLWGYSETRRKMVWFGWNQVHRPRSEGGFDIREILSWNKTLLMKWLWKLTVDDGSVWTKWIQAYVVKDHDFWTMAVSTTASYTWRALIMKIRDSFIALRGGRGAAVRDLMLWTKGGKLCLKQVYTSLRRTAAKQGWAKVVWDSVNLPRHSVIACMARQEGLATVDNFKKRGLPMVNRCVLCERAEESTAHLFFTCSVANEILQRLLIWTGITRRPLPLAQEFKRFTKNIRGTHWKKRWRRCSLIATLYEIWKEMNNRIFQERKRSIAQIVHDIKFVVAIRVFALKHGINDEELVESLVN